MNNCGKMVKLKIAIMIPGIMFALLIFAMMIISMQLDYMKDNAPNVLHVRQSETLHAPLEFPLEVCGTPLVIERTAMYDGPYVEDGSDDEVTGVAGIVLRNNGNEMVLRAEIVLEQGSRRLNFNAEMIPPGAAILILEANRSVYSMLDYTSCLANAWTETMPETSNEIKVVSRGMDRIMVTNQADKAMYDVEVMYKGWREDPGVYLGGITYVACLDELSAGATVEIYPEHYVAGYSRIVDVRYTETPTPTRRGRYY